MRGELGFLVPEPTEVDELAHTRTLGLARHRLGRPGVAVLEVGLAERMDEVVDDLSSVEDGADASGVEDVSLRPRDASLARSSRHRHDVV
jgi:hypothetical protein